MWPKKWKNSAHKITNLRDECDSESQKWKQHTHTHTRMKLLENDLKQMAHKVLAK